MFRKQSETSSRPSWRVVIRRRALTAGLTAILLTLFPPLMHGQCRQTVLIPPSEWLANPPVPAPDDPEASGRLRHTEREFKFSFGGTRVDNFSPLQLAEEINAVLNQAVQSDSLWKAPSIVSPDPAHPIRYRPRLTGDEQKEVGGDYFFDVYFDTRDDLNYFFDAIYRFRQRFDTKADFDNYLARVGTPPNPADRSESQSKVGRTFLDEPGLSTITESRRDFEFTRPEFISTALCEFQLGLFDSVRTVAADALIDFLIGQQQAHPQVRPPFALYPKLAILTERRRQHLLLPTIEINNPDSEAMLVTVDRGQVFEVGEILDYMHGDRDTAPSPKGSFMEVEVEFEKNTSVLFEDQQTGQPVDENTLTALERRFKNALQDDQSTFMNTIRTGFAHHGESLTVGPEIRSKYVKAHEILFNRARGKFARQSSTAGGAGADRAVDNNINGDFSAGSVTQTQIQRTPFWEVDLGGQYTITGLDIFNRTDCCAARLRNFWVIVSPFKLESDDLNEVLNSSPFPIKTFFLSEPIEQGTLSNNLPRIRSSILPRVRDSIQGRFVRIQLAGDDALNLAEVKVFGYPPSVNGSIEDLVISNRRTSTDTSGCPSGFIGKHSFDARLTNTSTESLFETAFEVVVMTNGNLLQNSDNQPEGIGARLTVPKTGNFADGILSRNEFVDVPFVICLRNDRPYRLEVNVVGGKAP